MSRFLAVIAIVVFAALPVVAFAQAPDPQNALYMDLSYGRVVIKLRPDLAPNHVARIKKLVKQGFYDGLKFFRVIDGFMAQTGDPRNDGTGDSSLPNLKAEFSETPFVRGSIGAARVGGDPDSANSQFFIVFDAAPWLDGDYTVWGEVVSGMEYVDKIRRGEPPVNPDKIIRVQIAVEAMGK